MNPRVPSPQAGHLPRRYATPWAAHALMHVHPLLHLNSQTRMISHVHVCSFAYFS